MSVWAAMCWVAEATDVGGKVSETPRSKEHFGRRRKRSYGAAAAIGVDRSLHAADHQSKNRSVRSAHRQFGQVHPLVGYFVDEDDGTGLDACDVLRRFAANEAELPGCQIHAETQ